MKNRRRTTLALAALGTAALAFTGCSGDTTASEPAPTVTVTAGPTIIDPPAPTSTPEPTLTERPDGPPMLGFGETFDYSDGISVAVASSGPMVANDYAGATEAVALDLTITNNTDAPFDPTGADTIVSFGPNGLDAESVYNMDLGWSGEYFTGTILPGRTATITSGYAIPAAYGNDLVVEFTPEWTNFDRGPVFYVSDPQ